MANVMIAPVRRSQTGRIELCMISAKLVDDNKYKGVWERGMILMLKVEVRLEYRRHTVTDANGSYRFPGVPRGARRVAVIYLSKVPFFFTTASDHEVEEDATVNFDIGYSLSA